MSGGQALSPQAADGFVPITVSAATLTPSRPRAATDAVARGGSPLGLDLVTSGAAPAPTVALQPYDQVFVRSAPGWEEPGTVVLTGELQFPGRYALRSKSERLLDVLQRAGGLTPAAYTNGIRFFRMGAAQMADSAPWRMATDTTVQDRTRPQNRDWATTGRIGVDLERVLGDASHRDNVVLQPGDSIDVPRYNPMIRVEGAVGAPGTSVPYRPGAGLKHYVNGAGGFAQLADKGKAFVQQPNGLIEKGDPEPGAVVVVPLRQTAPGGPTFFQVFTAVLAPLISAATTIAVVIAPRP